MKKTKLNLKKTIGFSLLFLFAITWYHMHYFHLESPLNFKIESSLRAAFLFLGITFMFPFHLIPYFFFNPEEEIANKTKQQLIQKLRYRGILFYNIAIIILIIAIVIILSSFYLLGSIKDFKNDTQMIIHNLAAVTVLIFLVQLLFRVFKYLLRLGGFYHSKADAIELNIIDATIDVDKMMTQLSPEKYDMTDLPLLSLSDFIKSKV